ncbi:MAG: cyclase family protein [Moorea sp. SIO2I5]|nr:cyclase family protein [Moorena sp. SIO2I5]
MAPLQNPPSKYIDISVPVSPYLPTWPGSPAIEFHRHLDLEDGDIATDTTLHFSVHTGTHVDAPMHFIPGGQSVEQLPLDVLIGECQVVVVPDDVDVITAEVLKQLTLPVNTQRLLLRTRNSRLWRSQVREFQPDFVALTADAAEWVVERGIRLIGVDYLSVQRFDDGPETHQILLKSEVVIIEGLNLTDISTGKYELLCLPIKLKGVEGAPARVILRKLYD